LAGKSKTDAAVDAANKSGNWDKASPAAKATLEKAGAKLRAAREVKPHERSSPTLPGYPNSRF
jgi:hypothetical protein